jgi:hypothetical protein
MLNRLTVLSAAGAGIALVSAALPASATEMPAAHQHSHVHGFHKLTHNSTSTNWSGYSANGSFGDYTTVSASWTLPTISCSGVSSSDTSAWVGIGGGNGSATGSLPQTGIDLECSNGSDTSYAWWEEYANNADQQGQYSNAVAGGDSITASVTWNSSTSKWDMKLTDSTQGWTQTTSKATTSGFSSGDSAEVITEIPTDSSTGNLTTISNFGSITYTGSKLNGSNFTSSNSTAIDLTDSSGNIVVKTGSISSGKFTTTQQ